LRNRGRNRRDILRMHFYIEWTHPFYA
jgi:hypothetical protein